MTNWRGYLTHDTPVIGPWGIAVTGISTTAMPAIGDDKVRHGVLFFNPQASTTLRVLPAGQPLIAGQGGIVVPPLDYFELYDSGGGVLDDAWSRVRINCGWQVVADTAGSWGLTVWVFTDQLGPQAKSRPNLHPPAANLNVDPDITSPVAWQLSLSTLTSQILPSNMQRRGLLFHNPGGVAKAVAPGNLPASLGAGSIILQPSASKEIRAIGKVRVSAAWNAVTAAATDRRLTALEYL